MNLDEVKGLAASVLEKAAARHEAAGINLLVIKDGKELLYLQNGYADIENHRPMERDTIMKLYSMSKPVTGAAIMILLERGYIDLNEAVSTYLPEFSNQVYQKNGELLPCSRQMTIHDLLFMTAGLSYGGDSVSGQAISQVFADMDKRILTDNPMSTAEFSKRIAACPLEYEPGSSFSYGVCADILGALVETVTGVSFETFLQEELFTPLSMQDTGFFVPQSKLSRLSEVYKRIPNGYALYTDNHLGIVNHMDHSPAFQSGGAGLFSTLDDYANFAAMLHNHGSFHGKQILQPETVRYFTNGSLQPWQQTSLDSWGGLEGYSYGNLMRVMKDPSRSIMLTTPGEYGWDGWLGPYFSNHPDCGLTILSGMQMTDTGTAPVLRKLRNLILSRL